MRSPVRDSWQRQRPGVERHYSIKQGADEKSPPVCHQVGFVFSRHIVRILSDAPLWLTSLGQAFELPNNGPVSRYEYDEM